MNEKERKELMEKRASLISEMNELTDGIAKEARAFTDDEQKEFDSRRDEVKRIDASMAAAEELRALNVETAIPEKKGTEEEEQVRAFANILRQRDDANITKTDNGAVIPTLVAKKIIDRINDISPLFGAAEKFNVKGNVVIPYVDASNDNIAVAYATEFTDLEAKDTKLLGVTLTGFLAGVLTKISKSLLNSTDLNLTNFVIEKIANAGATFIDHEVIIGTPASSSGSSTIPAKITGLSDVTDIKETGSSGAISMDDIITLRDELKTAYQKDAFFVMHPKTLDAIRHLKDGNNHYYVLDDVTADFGVRLLGKRVYTSDQCEQIAGNKKVIYYGDFKQALAGKIVEDSLQILNEKYATQHALGVVYWTELDCKVQNQQAVAGLKVKS